MNTASIGTAASICIADSIGAAKSFNTVGTTTSICTADSIGMLPPRLVQPAPLVQLTRLVLPSQLVQRCNGTIAGLG
jgi:hypothetical protein